MRVTLEPCGRALPFREARGVRIPQILPWTQASLLCRSKLNLKPFLSFLKGEWGQKAKGVLSRFRIPGPFLWLPTADLCCHLIRTWAQGADSSVLQEWLQRTCAAPHRLSVSCKRVDFLPSERKVLIVNRGVNLSYGICYLHCPDLGITPGPQGE